MTTHTSTDSMSANDYEAHRPVWAAQVAARLMLGAGLTARDAIEQACTYVTATEDAALEGGSPVDPSADLDGYDQDMADELALRLRRDFPVMINVQLGI